MTVLKGDLADNFFKDVLAFEKTVTAEALTRVIALPIPRRFRLQHLLEEPGGILGRGIFERLTPIAQHDVSQACRCIAFECSTGAAFHTLRCVEECIRMLYQSYFARKKINNRAWGVLTKELNGKQNKPKPDGTLMAHLDHLRKRFRNPTDHPDKTYEVEEAEDLLHLAVDAINRILRDPKVSKKY
jgi:hypothetical protein